jgi:hypothetical protein
MNQYNPSDCLPYRERDANAFTPNYVVHIITLTYYAQNKEKYYTNYYRSAGNYAGGYAQFDDYHHQEDSW